jgi:streptogramin lyase
MAGFEFEARLRLELREAAQREQRRGRVARVVAAGRSLLPAIGHSALPVAAVAATIAAAIAVAALFLLSGTEQRAVAPPEEVAEFAVADTLGGSVAAYGSVWMNDTTRAELLRVDPDSRRVSARLPVRGEVSVASGAGSLWALQEGSFPARFHFRGPVLRIDPSTNEVTARIPLRTPAGQPFEGIEVLSAGDAVWVAGPSGALRIDSRTNRVTRAIAPPGGDVGSDFALWRGELWALTADGRLLGFDSRTAAKLSEVPLALAQASRPLMTAAGALVTTVSGGLARIDPYSGRVQWSRHIGEVQALTGAGGLIWARSSGRVQDRLHALEPKTGHVMTSIQLHDFSGAGIVAIEDELWLSTVGGRVVVFRR